MDDKAIENKVRDRLQTTPYAASSLKLLSGGNTNFIYAATLQKTLQDGTSLVAWKHGEAYAASWFNFKLTTDRCVLEAETLEYLEKKPPLKTPSFTIQTPKFYYFDKETNTQVQECLPDPINLKMYALKYYKLPVDASVRGQCSELGTALGKWLQSFHEWGRRPENVQLRQIVSQIKTMQSLKHMVNYKSLVRKVDKHPELLAEHEELFQQICDEAASETADESKLDVIHGDFWTGNILLSDTAIKDGTENAVRVVDWEMVQLGLPALDIGQMIAELWQLVFFKRIEYAQWIIDGLMKGYGQVSEQFAFRAIVHVGTHFIAFGEQTPGWGTPEQCKDLVLTGRDVILAARRKDRAFFTQHPLSCLFV